MQVDSFLNDFFASILFKRGKQDGQSGESGVVSAANFKRPEVVFGQMNESGVFSLLFN